MNRADMLLQLGLSDSEFSDLLQKFNGFVNQLNSNQQNVIQNSIISISAAAATFGPTATVDDVQNLLGTSTGTSGSQASICIVLAAGK